MDEDNSDLDGSDDDLATPQGIFMTQVCKHDPKKSLRSLKRHPLPATVTWNSKGETMEKYIAAFEGHVDQQQYMSYLLIPELGMLWLKYGDHKKVLTIAKLKQFLV